MLKSWLVDNPGAKLSLLGVGGNNLAPARQSDLFSTDIKQGNTVVDNTVDEIRDRFGTSSVARARTLDGRRLG